MGIVKKGPDEEKTKGRKGWGGCGGFPSLRLGCGGNRGNRSSKKEGVSVTF